METCFQLHVSIRVLLVDTCISCILMPMRSVVNVSSFNILHKGVMQ